MTGSLNDAEADWAATKLRKHFSMPVVYLPHKPMASRLGGHDYDEIAVITA